MEHAGTRKRQCILRAADKKSSALHLLGLFGAIVCLWNVRSAQAFEVGPTAGVSATELKTENAREPLGVDSSQPRFRWLLEAMRRGQRQTAYQILVATSLEKLNTNNGDIWDSRKVDSDNSVAVSYTGRDLAAGERAYWKVRVWDDQGHPSAYSAPAWFEIGLTSPSDWQGRWIAAKRGISSPLLRREFSIDGSIRQARVYVSGLGYYELSLNGRRVGDRVLDPASTYYHNDQPFRLGSRVFYSTYDITGLLQPGHNAIGVMLGHGWYSGESDASFRSVYGDRPKLILQMNIELVDGRRLSVVSDPSWRTASGPVTYNDFSNGETYDARLEQADWNRAGFNDTNWQFAETADAPSGVLVAQSLPPEQVVMTLPLLRRIAPKAPLDEYLKIYVYDFGQNITGWVRFAASGLRGTALVLRYGARLYPEDDRLDTRSNDTPAAGARQSDTYIFKGEGIETWEPRFTEHGFRYVEARVDFDNPASIQKMEAHVVRSAVESTGTFECSNELLNRIHHNIQRTLQSSFHGIMQDAPERAEREGWLGDPGFVAEDYLNNFDMSAFWEKWLEDIRLSQREDGAIPTMAPMHLRPADYQVWPSWQSTYPILVWNLYQFNGDRQLLRTHYPSLKKLLVFLQASSKGDLISDEWLGDHMEPQDEGFTRLESHRTPHGLTASAYYFQHAILLSQIADVLGESHDAHAFGRLAGRIKQAFNRKYLDLKTNRYATGSQTSNALPLYLGLVPADRVRRVLKNLVDDITNAHDLHLTTGIIGSNAVVQALPQLDEASLLYRLATQTTYPSLGHQVQMGATTVCETYECGPGQSQNMKMFASLDKFFYRNLAGIRPASPGYRRVLIQPEPLGDLRYVSAKQKTVRGEVKVDWRREEGRFELNVSIPAGMDAEVVIPKLGRHDPRISEAGASVWASDAFVRGTPGIVGGKADDEAIRFQAGSGDYRFVMQ